MKTYKICKGCHYSNYFPWIDLFHDQFSMMHMIMFDDSCLYHVDEPSCVNKLFGCAFGLFGVHKYSVRFGWACTDGKIDIYRYVYSSGKLFKKVIKTVEVNETHLYRIDVRHSFNNTVNVSLSIDGSYLDTFVIDSVDRKLCVGLGPYFGGNSRAPHKMLMYFNGKQSTYRDNN